MITSFHAENFRGFEKLELEGFKRCNLIVGRNNSGKTSFLEAISYLVTLSVEYASCFRQTEGAQGFAGLESFVRRGSDIKLFLLSLIEDDGSTLQLRHIGKDDPSAFRHGKIVEFAENEFQHTFSLVGDILGLTLYKSSHFRPRSLRLIHSSLKPPLELAEPYSKVASVAGGEEKLESLLRRIDPRIRKLRLLKDGKQSIIKVDYGLREMLPLSQSGEGLKRILWILTDIISTRPDWLFIDEIENGIHHSQLGNVWQGIAEAAEEYNVQVFASTHSYECITAAHDVFSKRAEYDFSLIQLFRTEIECTGRVLQKETIEAAIENDIELR